MKTPVCPACGSSKLFFDATAVWDPVIQQKEMVTSYDSFKCEECGASGNSPDWKKLMKAVLTITVYYGVDEAERIDVAHEEIVELLMAASNGLASEGRLSGEPNITVVQWDADVTVTS